MSNHQSLQLALSSFSCKTWSCWALVATLGISGPAFCQKISDGTQGGDELIAAFDRAVSPLIEKWKVPGLSLVVAKDGKLVFAKGYGYADIDNHTPMSTSTLFRMGSINKTLTAAAIMKLIERKKIDLDDPVLPILSQANVVPETLGDDRMKENTVRQLLQHTAGFDRETSGDPFFQPRLLDVARRQGVAPVTCEVIIRDSLSLPLDFPPGTRFAYSNLGYCMLGIVIRVTAGEPYKTFVSRELLEPSIGKSYLAGQTKSSMPGESTYYMPSSASRGKAAPGVDASQWGVLAPYGSYSIENMEALGQWVATPTDVLKFYLALDGARGPRLLAPDSLNKMREPPAFAVVQGQIPSTYYGMGLYIRQTPRGPNWWHSGSQPGLDTLALRSSEGFSWVFAINTRPTVPNRSAFSLDFDRAMWSAARSIRKWPEKDTIE